MNGSSLVGRCPGGIVRHSDELAQITLDGVFGEAQLSGDGADAKALLV